MVDVPKVQTVEVTDEDAGQRVDNWLLKRLKGVRYAEPDGWVSTGPLIKP